MNGRENSLVHAGRGNGVVPGSAESLQEIVRILTQCHRLIGAGGVFRPASAMRRRGIRQPTKRDFCRDGKDQLLRTLLPSGTRVPNASGMPVEGCGVDPRFREHRPARLHLEDIMP
jgi:hypothetical protein